MILTVECECVDLYCCTVVLSISTDFFFFFLSFKKKKRCWWAKFGASGRVLKVLSRQWFSRGFVVLSVGFALCVCELLYRGPTTTCVLDILFCCETDYFVRFQVFILRTAGIGLVVGLVFPASQVCATVKSALDSCYSSFFFAPSLLYCLQWVNICSGSFSV